MGRPRSHYPSPRTPPRRSPFPTRDVLARQESVRDVARRVRARARAGGTPLAPSPLRCVATASSARARSRALTAASGPNEGGFAVAGVALVGALAGTLTVATLDPTRADAPPEVGSLPFDRAQAVVDYLASAGASFPRVDVRPVDTGVGHVEAHGMGIFAKRSPGDIAEDGGGGGGGLLGSLFGSGTRPVTMARVPARLAITAAAAAQHPTLGPTFKEMLENDDIDERMAVMLLLIVERRRGDKSPIKPYLDALPSSFRTPLFYDPEEMDGLRGTNLHGAVAAQREQLANVLRGHVRPAAARLFAALRETPSPDAVALGSLASTRSIRSASASSASASTLDPSRPRSSCGRTRASGRARSLFR